MSLSLVNAIVIGKCHCHWQMSLSLVNVIVISKFKKISVKKELPSKTKFFMHFCPGTMTTHAESINSDLQRGLDRRLRYTQH